MNNNHCRFLFVLFKARIIGIASSSASCKKGGIYSYKVEVTFAIDIENSYGIKQGYIYGKKNTAIGRSNFALTTIFLHKKPLSAIYSHF